jgi:hypothetical protein
MEHPRKGQIVRVFRVTGRLADSVLPFDAGANCGAQADGSVDVIDSPIKNVHERTIDVIVGPPDFAFFQEASPCQ